MEYKFFDKKFLVMPDDKSIIGKRVFYADHIQDLIKDVESGDFGQTGVLEDNTVNDEDAFVVKATYCSSPAMWGLVYHDPNYECKVAYSQGKQIQVWSLSGTWEGVAGTPMWSANTKYRVKPDKWFVHDMADGKFYKDNSSDTYVEFEGTEAECDIWIAEHTPKSRRYTNRELAKWCADNKGQYKVKGGMCYTQHTYYECDENTQVAEEILIREWGSNEWHEPLVEVKE